MVATMEKLNDSYSLDGEAQNVLHLEYPFLNNDNNVEFRHAGELTQKANRFWLDMKTKCFILESNQGKKVRCQLPDSTPEFWGEIHKFNQQILRILSEYSERLSKESEFLTVYICEGQMKLFIPETMIDYSLYSTKFIVGFVYHMNRLLGTKLSYDELQLLFQKAFAEQKIQDGKETMRLSTAMLVQQVKKTTK